MTLMRYGLAAAMTLMRYGLAAAMVVLLAGCAADTGEPVGTGSGVDQYPLSPCACIPVQQSPTGPADRERLAREIHRLAG